MQELVCTTPFEWKYQESERPTLKEGMAILKIKQVGICGTDLHAFEGTQPFFSYPRILGHEFVGEIVEISSESNYRIGSFVSVIPYYSCGKCVACRQGKTNCCQTLSVLGVHEDGAMRDFLQVPIDALVHDEQLSLDEYTLLEPLSIGAHGVRRAEIKKDDWVLVVGAGPIGLGVMEMARIAGGQVIALDVNAGRLDFSKNVLGVSHTIQVGQEDVMAHLQEITKGDMPQVIIDATGNKKAIDHSFQYMAHGGKYILVGLQLDHVQFSHPEFHKREGTLMSSRNATRGDFEWVMDCMKKGLIHTQDFITHRTKFNDVSKHFESFLDPAQAVIKAVVEFDS
ncbi:zinc-binding alcohol dehydrogenase family protein [Aquirufa ecclesiirivi]|uniref:Zinc-binding alcohol dehydrogenase family protein n=1 Tax=Aquirufa ecclesiirivi TaxID=2715124 RepID=A0ABT4JI04_9BACT|nr:zinc-binding alcohol dehydrogenase family protein [Aquirufa ecclesiirivi]MCZ2475568.1 zinc-binding alcohol dehydrogenase family protein [Aquirufa ecclesiirivi]